MDDNGKEEEMRYYTVMGKYAVKLSSMQLENVTVTIKKKWQKEFAIHPDMVWVLRRMCTNANASEMNSRNEYNIIAYTSALSVEKMEKHSSTMLIHNIMDHRDMIGH